MGVVGGAISGGQPATVKSATLFSVPSQRGGDIFRMSFCLKSLLRTDFEKARILWKSFGFITGGL